MIRKTLGIVIYYCGELKETQENILSYIDSVDKLLVWLNSDELVFTKWDTPELMAAREKIEFLNAGEGNVGIGKALNAAVRYGINNGYEYLLSMDQDSSWENIEAYLAEISNYDNDPLAAIFTPTIDRGNGEILPGAVFKLSMFGQTGLFNEAYFVDSTDHEFCYRAAQHDFRIVQTENGLLRHHPGHEAPIEDTKYKCENYSAKRLFYIYRSMMWIRRSYPKEVLNECYLHYFKDTFLCRFKWILLGEDDKLAKLAAIIRGTFVGLTTEPQPAPVLKEE